MTVSALEAELRLAHAAVGEAKKVLEAASTSAVRIEAESRRDVKISADRISEERLLDVLRESEYPVLAEESASEGELDSDSFWVVDPLDGTMNFLRGIPLYCIAVGLVEDGRPVLGVVLDMERSCLYSGVVGFGAWRGSIGEALAEPIRVSDHAARGSAVLATGLPAARDYSTDALQDLLPLFQEFKKVRMFGTAGLSLTFLAAGVVDAYAEDDIKIWDVAAGIALVRSAGGFVRSRSSGIRDALCVRASSAPEIWEGLIAGFDDEEEGILW